MARSLSRVIPSAFLISTATLLQTIPTYRCLIRSCRLVTSLQRQAERLLGLVSPPNRKRCQSSPVNIHQNYIKPHITLQPAFSHNTIYGNPRQDTKTIPNQQLVRPCRETVVVRAVNSIIPRLGRRKQNSDSQLGRHELVLSGLHLSRLGMSQFLVLQTVSSAVVRSELMHYASFRHGISMSFCPCYKVLCGPKLWLRAKHK